MNVERPSFALLCLCSKSNTTALLARDGGSAEWHDNEGIFIVNSFQEVSSKLSARAAEFLYFLFSFWNFKRKVQLLLFTFAVQCQYIPIVDLGERHWILWDFRLAFFFFFFFFCLYFGHVFNLLLNFFNNFIMVLIFLNLPIFWSWQHFT